VVTAMMTRDATRSDSLLTLFDFIISQSYFGPSPLSPSREWLQQARYFFRPMASLRRMSLSGGSQLSESRSFEFATQKR